MTCYVDVYPLLCRTISRSNSCYFTLTKFLNLAFRPSTFKRKIHILIHVLKPHVLTVTLNTYWWQHYLIWLADMMPVHYWQLLASGTCSKNTILLITFRIKINLFRGNCYCPPHPTDALSTATCSDTAGPASDPNDPLTNKPIVESKLLVSDAVLLSTDAICVSRHERSYVRYKIM